MADPAPVPPKRTSSQQMRGKRGPRPPGLMMMAEPKPEAPSVKAAAAAAKQAGSKSGLGMLQLDGKEFRITDRDLKREEHLGSGTYGEVCKVMHKTTGTVMAVKQMRDSMDPDERQQLLLQIDLCKSAERCPYIVDYYGAQAREGFIMLYMEIMSTSLDKSYGHLTEKKMNYPNGVLAYIAVSVLEGLVYLKRELKVMHRDVKPSNILLGFNGEIKLCDFGMSKVMEQSLLHTHVGCERYLAPERLDPSAKANEYGTEADVWSYGITLVELGMCAFPYKYTKAFEVLTKIVTEAAPQLPSDLYEPKFCEFVAECLLKHRDDRPPLTKKSKNGHGPLEEHPFFLEMKKKDTVDQKAWLVQHAIPPLDKA
mmetsp:Transcript_30343/g.91000  ORF Transcript_30343/g.91000 Transcript_30343/m.91000 type:complete len:368 (-) Transcript_30343:102-1205(-)